jgi:hypothetical protein
MTTVLTAAQLFQPAPSGVGPAGIVPSSPVSGSWLATMLDIAAVVQLPTTSWQSGAPERTILAIEAVTFQESDVNISIMAQGGFLQTAATGTVTYTALDGTSVTVPVTPDPSNEAQNPSGSSGWLDLLTSTVYDVERLSASYAAGPLAIVNPTSFSKGPFAAGQYHVANTSTGATYTNLATVSIPPSTIGGSGGVVSAVTSTLAATTIQTTGPHGLSVGQTVYIVIPQTSGVSGLNGVFAIVTAAATSTFQIAIGSSGFFTGPGTVYLCTVTQMQADTVGIGSNAAPNTVTTAVTQAAGVFISNVIGWSGSNYESNTALANRAQLSLAAASPNGPSQAYIYFAETAGQILADATPPYTLTNGPVTANTSSNPQTGIVTTVIASTTPASATLGANVTPGVAQLQIVAVSNANPCVVTCVGPTTLVPSQSMTVTISGVIGVTGVNGTFLGTYVGANSFSIPVDTTSAGSYIGGGSVEGGDLGQIDKLLQQNVVPDDVTAVTLSALALPINITATVVVPQANVQAYKLAAPQQLQTQLASYAIGGNSPSFAVAYDDIIGALEEAGVLTLGSASYVRSIQALSLNGGGVNSGVAFPSNQYQAVLGTIALTVLGT